MSSHSAAVAAVNVMKEVFSKTSVAKLPEVMLKSRAGGRPGGFCQNFLAFLGLSTKDRIGNLDKLFGIIQKALMISYQSCNDFISVDLLSVTYCYCYTTPSGLLASHGRRFHAVYRVTAFVSCPLRPL